MLWMVSALLLVLWLFGMVSGATPGPTIHALLVLAAISVAAALMRPGPRDTI